MVVDPLTTKTRPVRRRKATVEIAEPTRKASRTTCKPNATAQGSSGAICSDEDEIGEVEDLDNPDYAARSGKIAGKREGKG
ncbi:hypothetical protein Rt10032_c18g5951 [Rhodotorula toruloides]|uniref:Uncharacterized protein n=1 Tax=Rhodotorula toruloides TaxID=5286 RepID=A0A511KQY7_RHOTO|nr:hypothetical protein Rt10032_c18g5951 [Rhodotorula toruloides]